ncbi:PREDICTED: CD48 antigen isoform X2 [Condylura cristata]|uniref:CD48 antigen isoform X2 n=1 Tax=Condylura cristata TaxID=143302 RepID=UPI00064321C1|nr:PREDICTED: CD48 antigen isoform X2 [Condylura cristata]
MYRRRWERCLFLLLFLREPGTQGQPEAQKALSGYKVTLFFPELPDYKDFTLLFGKKSIATYTAGNFKDFENEFKGRVHFVKNGVLTIYNVQKNDSGIYTLKRWNYEGKEEEAMIQLQVFDPVPQPTLTQDLKKGNNSCILTLSCYVSDTFVCYTWFREGKHLPEFQDSVIEVIIDHQNYSSSYTCMVSNPLDSKNVTVFWTASMLELLSCTQAPSFAGRACIANWLVVVLPIVLGLLLT